MPAEADGLVPAAREGEGEDDAGAAGAFVVAGAEGKVDAASEPPARAAATRSATRFRAWTASSCAALSSSGGGSSSSLSSSGAAGADAGGAGGGARGGAGGSSSISSSIAIARARVWRARGGRRGRAKQTCGRDFFVPRRKVRLGRGAPVTSDGSRQCATRAPVRRARRAPAHVDAPARAHAAPPRREPPAVHRASATRVGVSVRRPSRPVAMGSSLARAPISYEPRGEWFDGEIRRFVRLDNADPPALGGILFVGSSIFREWREARDFDADFRAPPRPQPSLWRVPDGRSPRRRRPRGGRLPAPPARDRVLLRVQRPQLGRPPRAHPRQLRALPPRGARETRVARDPSRSSSSPSTARRRRDRCGASSTPQTRSWRRTARRRRTSRSWTSTPDSSNPATRAGRTSGRGSSATTACTSARRRTTSSSRTSGRRWRRRGTRRGVRRPTARRGGGTGAEAARAGGGGRAPPARHATGKVRYL